MLVGELRELSVLSRAHLEDFLDVPVWWWTGVGNERGIRSEPAYTLYRAAKPAHALAPIFGLRLHLAGKQGTYGGLDRTYLQTSPTDERQLLIGSPLLELWLPNL